MFPSGDTATARTGVTSAGGRLTTIFGRAIAVVGAFAPWSIHSLTRASSSGVSGSSVSGGMIGRFCQLQNWNRLLSAAFPGTTALPRFPPFNTPAWVLMSNLASMMIPEWQYRHFSLKMGAMSLPYSTGSVRFRSTVGIGVGGGSSFFWARAVDGARRRASRGR